MNDQDQISTDELFDSFTPYEIAVLSFTSPKAIVNIDNSNQILSLTAKQAYLWAGTIAHAIILNSDLSSEHFLSSLKNAYDYSLDRWYPYTEAFEIKVGTPFPLSELYVFDKFLQNLGIWDERALIFRRTEDAVRSLIWRDHIVDPFKKKVGAAIISVVLLMPIGFTSVGSKEVKLNSLTWEYVQRAENNQTERMFRFKTKEISEVVLNNIVPAAINAFDKLSSSQSGEGLSITDIQRKLKNKGYYKGPIDGIAGPKTITALRKFQRDHYLNETGYIDTSTRKRLF